MLQRSYLYDQTFLEELSLSNNREVYIKIILLTLNENAVEQIEGIASQGSISIQGTSAVQRTCSLTLLSNDVNINSFLWGLNSKIQIEIGLKNNVNKNYPDICWFKQGIFVITSFSMSQQTNNFQISISAKDKMCLLDGTIGGMIQAQTDFGTKDIIQPNGDIINELIPIESIIREAVHTYAKEPYHNIIINNIDDFGLSLLDYRGENSLYIYGPAEDFLQDGNDNILFNDSYVWVYDDQNGNNKVAQGKLSSIKDEYFYKLFNLSATQGSYYYFKFDENSSKTYHILKFNGGERSAIGYLPTALTYPGELIAAVGSNIKTAVLDKITQLFPTFEYFYNVDGQFVFQKKSQYLTPASLLLRDKDISFFIEPKYKFTDSKIITNYSINPDFQNIKNDFAIWGEREGVTGAKIPIYSRCAIDKKPRYYQPISNYAYSVKELLTMDVLDILINQKFNFYYHEDGIIKKIAGANIDKNKTTEEQEKAMQLEIERIKDSINAAYSNNKDLMLYIQTCIMHEDEDWRYQLFKMAQDNSWHGTMDNFQSLRQELNRTYALEDFQYEQYYTDILEFWNSYEYKILNNFKLLCMTGYWERFINSDNSFDFFSYVLLQDNDSKKFYGIPYIIDLLRKKEATHTELLNIFSSAWVDYSSKIFYKKDQNSTPTVCIANGNVTGLGAIFLKNQDCDFSHYSKDYTFKTTLLDSFWNSITADSGKRLIEILNKYNFSLVTLGVQNDSSSQYIFNDQNKNILNSLGGEFCLIAKKPLQIAYGDGIDLKFLNSNSNNFPVFQNFYYSLHYPQPENLTRWFDFYEPGQELNNYAVKTIGQRMIAKNDTKIKSIDYKSVPNLLFCNLNITDIEIIPDIDYKNYSHIYINPHLQDLFTISSKTASAQDKINEWMNQYLYPVTSLTFTSLPVYWLQPNDKIIVTDNENQINGEYIVSSISIPLIYNGTTSITATKILNTEIK